jgi:hypothetical protein
MRLRSLHLLLLLAAIVIAGGCKNRGTMDDETKSAIDEHLAEIPASAKQVAEGRAAIKHTAEMSGMLYLYDPQLRRVLDAQRIYKGQTYRVSSDRTALWLDDKGSRLNGLSNEHLLRVYIDPG